MKKKLNEKYSLFLKSFHIILFFIFYCFKSTGIRTWTEIFWFFQIAPTFSEWLLVSVESRSRPFKLLKRFQEASSRITILHTCVFERLEGLLFYNINVIHPRFFLFFFFGETTKLLFKSPLIALLTIKISSLKQLKPLIFG